LVSSLGPTAKSNLAPSQNPDELKQFISYNLQLSTRNSRSVSSDVEANK
jgi:hypothetical protein